MIDGTAGTELAKSGFETFYPVGRGTPVYAILPFNPTKTLKLSL